MILLRASLPQGKVAPVIRRCRLARVRQILDRPRDAAYSSANVSSDRRVRAEASHGVAVIGDSYHRLGGNGAGSSSHHDVPEASRGIRSGCRDSARRPGPDQAHRAHGARYARSVGGRPGPRGRASRLLGRAFDRPSGGSRRRPWPGAGSRGGCRPGWWRCRRGSEAPGRRADRPRTRGDGSPKECRRIWGWTRWSSP